MTGQQSFLSIFVAEMGVRMLLIVVFMVLLVTGALVGMAIGEGPGAGLGALAGLLLGCLFYAVVIRRFNSRPKQTAPESSS